MHHKKTMGIVFVSVGCGILINLIIPQNFWCFIMGIIFITIGFLLISPDKKKC